MKFIWLERLEEGLIAFLLAAMTLVTFAQVVARYGFNYSFVWALELTTYLFGALIFIGMSYGVRVGAHIGVDALVKILPATLARRVAVVASLLCLLYAAIVFIGGWVYVSKIYEIGILAQDLPIPQWVPRLVLPIGFALLFIRFAQVLFELLGGKENHLLGDEVEDALKYRSDTGDNATPEHK
ncbi:MAG: TRAP transporter small permease [Candidimonas sp.]|nr:MAG: TRAP transporter small permease [Candidimonas sp.]TAM24229.1 MAG: TRAP transporter small permease [Candidimonas sp.]